MEAWRPIHTDASKPAPALPEGLPPGVTPHFFPKNPVDGENDFTHCIISRDTEIKHGDEASIRVETERGTDDLGISLTPMKVEPDTSYTVRAWLRGENISPQTANGGVVFFVQDGGEREIWSTPLTAIPRNEKVQAGTFDWTKVEFTTKTKPESNRLGIRFVLHAASGKLWIDDVSVKPEER